MEGPIVISAATARLRLRAGDVVLMPQFECGDVRIGLWGDRSHPVEFSEFLVAGRDPAVLLFLRQHPVVDVEYFVELTDFGSPDRQLVVEHCRVEAVELVEAEGGTSIRYRLVGERLVGDLFGFLQAA